MKRRFEILRNGWPKYRPSHEVNHRRGLNEVTKGEHAIRRLMARIYREVRRRPDFHIRVSVESSEWLVQLHLWNTQPYMFNFGCKNDKMTVTWMLNKEQYNLEIAYSECLLHLPEILKGEFIKRQKELTAFERNARISH